MKTNQSSPLLLNAGPGGPGGTTGGTAKQPTTTRAEEVLALTPDTAYEDCAATHMCIRQAQRHDSQAGLSATLAGGSQGVRKLGRMSGRKRRKARCGSMPARRT